MASLNVFAVKLYDVLCDIITDKSQQCYVITVL